MSIHRAAALIAVFSLVSKLLGFIRQAVFANKFGFGEELDIYVAAFRIPDLLFNFLILGTLSVAFIPVFVEYLHKDRRESVKIASTIFTLTFLVMGALALIALALSRPLVDLITPGFSPESREQTLLLTRVMLLSPLFFSLSSVLASTLHSYKKFFIASVAPMFYNLSIIAGALFLYPLLGLVGLAYGVVLGAALHFLIQFPESLSLGLRPFRQFYPNHPGVRKIGKLFLPRLLGMDLGQISLLVASVVASFGAAGQLSAFYFAYDLETVPVGIFSVSIAIAAFPAMAEYASRGDLAGFKRFFSKMVIQILYFIIPISVLLLLLRAQVVRLVWGAGQGTSFTFEDTRLGAATLGVFALSLFAQSLIPLLTRSFYALQNTVTPMLVGIAAAAINIAVAVFVRSSASAILLAAAFSIAVFVNMGVLFVLLRRRLGDLADDVLLIKVIKIIIASVAMGTAAYLTMNLVAPLVDMSTYTGVLVQTLSATIVAVGVYLGCGLLIHLPESRQVALVIRSWYGKFARPVSSLIADMFTDLR